MLGETQLVVPTNHPMASFLRPGTLYTANVVAQPSNPENLVIRFRAPLETPKVWLYSGLGLLFGVTVGYFIGGYHQHS